MLALWWVELGLVLLMCRAFSRDLFRGGCELSMSSGSLSADGCVCVPILPVVCPEAFQH